MALWQRGLHKNYCDNMSSSLTIITVCVYGTVLVQILWWCTLLSPSQPSHIRSHNFIFSHAECSYPNIFCFTYQGTSALLYANSAVTERLLSVLQSTGTLFFLVRRKENRTCWYRSRIVILYSHCKEITHRLMFPVICLADLCEHWQHRGKQTYWCAVFSSCAGNQPRLDK